MKIKKYLSQKYGFELNSVMPSSMLEDELLISESECKELIRVEQGVKRSAKEISFGEYCNICENFLG